MRPALSLTFAVVFGLLLAGCNGPGHAPTVPQETSAQPTPMPAPEYTATIVVTKETPNGEPVRAQVQGTPLKADGKLGDVQQRGTDVQGAALFRFSEPTTLLVRVLGPDGWTSEGARVHIGAAVAAEGLTVSDRDVFIPLYRSTLTFLGEHAWSTQVAQPGAEGVAPAVAVEPLLFPEGLQVAYLSRLSGARVVASWTDTQDGRALNASVGLAWGDAVWVEGPAAPLTQTGPRQAIWDGALPSDGKPSDLAAASLQTAVLTRTAIVGDVLFSLETTLQFGGRVPAELPADNCHTLC
ncbi:MAG: hypothetical protein AABY18_08715 [Candidatus Thermoplasmatota archaeon]